MIVRVQSGSKSQSGFMIVGRKWEAEVYNSKQEAKAMAYVLTNSLPSSTLEELSKMLHEIVHDRSFSENDAYYQACKKSAEELEVK